MGNPLGRPPKPPEERFWKQVDKNGPNGCWLWTGHLQRNGYALLYINAQKVVGVHVFSLQLHGRPVPKGMVGDHLCRVRHCVNPDHLDVKTQRENALASPFTQAAKNAAKTHCIRDHPFDAENTYVPPGEPNRRQCRKCKLLGERRRAAA